MGSETSLLRDESGKLKNENQLIKVKYNDIVWMNTLKNLDKIGFFKYVVEKIYSKDENGKDIEVMDCEDLKQEIQNAIESALRPKNAVILTPDQKRIKELEDKINAILSEKSEPVKEVKAEIDPLLAEARKAYYDKFGKKGHHSWTVDEINEKINAE